MLIKLSLAACIACSELSSAEPTARLLLVADPACASSAANLSAFLARGEALTELRELGDRGAAESALLGPAALNMPNGLLGRELPDAVLAPVTAA
jgi:hypothetical protein